MSFLEIFQPGLRHLREERERQRMDVAHPTDGADPLMEIDLDAGTATIVIPSPAPPPSPEATETPGATETHEATGPHEAMAPGPDGTGSSDTDEPT